jgi:pimeloyl-ACP methyl ester carboxylesterase
LAALARFARRAIVFLLVAGVVLFLLPAEKMPPTGAWLARAGLEPRMATIGRLNIRYVRKGQGPTLILIHGLASSIYTWADVIGPLSEKFDVIALDLPGFGASSQPADLSFDDNPNAVLGLMDALGVSRAHFAGNSMGGAVSLLIAARKPERVDRLVVLDSAGFNMKPNERPFVVQLLASRAAGALSDGLPIRRFLTATTLRHLIRDDSRVTEERINEYVAPLLRPGALLSARSLLLSRLDERFEADLGAIAAPTLVVWGRFDPWLPEAHADRFVAAIRGARKVVLETGHMPQEEKPSDVARLIGEFLIS